MKAIRNPLLRIAAGVVVILNANAAESRKIPPPVRGFQEVANARVKLSGGFWGPRVKTAHEAPILSIDFVLCAVKRSIPTRRSP